MRDGGRPSVHRRFFPQGARVTAARQEVCVQGGRRVTLTGSKLGVNLCLFVEWTGQLVAHQFFPWELWLSIDDHFRRRMFMDFFKRPSKSSSPVGQNGVPFVDTELSSIAPTVSAYLSMDAWCDGEVRERSTLIILFQDGQYKICLSDKNDGMTLWAASNTFLGLLEALESRLTEATPDWRKQRQWKKKG